MTTERRRGLTIRARMMLLVVSLTALALLVAGVTLWAAQVRRVDAAITQQLEHANAVFDTFAGTATDPATNAPFGSTADLLRTALGYQVPTEHETILGVVDGQVRFARVPLAEVSPELIAASTSAPTDRIRISTLATPAATYRWLTVPVVVGDGPPGAFVVALNRTAMLAPGYATLWTFAIISVAALGLVSAIGWVLLGRMLRPVTELRRLSTEIANSDFSRRLPVRGSDDLAQLSASFNRMVDHLTSVFASQRQLLDDVGHELRTPITVVRGHLELMAPDDPEDVAATRTLTLSELDRMHRLTEDLVLLARSETPDLLRLGEVDVDDLTATVFEHAQRLGARRWELTETARCALRGDAERLTQAWLQLAANAVKFSEPGTAIRLASRQEGERVLLSVADEGRGVPEQDRQRIFERFAQTGEDRGGSGLGLAIVRAIARAHGGEVGVESEPGSGSTFTIEVPARTIEERG